MEVGKLQEPQGDVSFPGENGGRLSSGGQALGFWMQRSEGSPDLWPVVAAVLSGDDACRTDLVVSVLLPTCPWRSEGASRDSGMGRGPCQPAPSSRRERVARAGEVGIPGALGKEQ